MRRGEIWWSDPDAHYVVVLTRSAAIDVRSLVTVAYCTTQLRDIASHVEIDHLNETTAVNLDAVQTVRRTDLTKHVGSLDETEMLAVCEALDFALGCD